jgi:hypothetical protein
LRAADPEFDQIVETLRKAQISGHVGIRVERDKDKKDEVAFFFRDKDIDPALAQELAAVRRLLRLDADRSDFPVSFGATAVNPNEIAIQSRSVLRILSELSTFVDVPDCHLANGTAPFLGAETEHARPLFRVCSGCEKPCNAFAAVCYEGHWFWIDKCDFHSKRTIAYMLVLLALADTGAKEGLPVITIQAN